ncbi:hypothetical protein NXS19_012080 [Fusarium pseudograminearum]|nr:hypothetical protein NXS19_012080 [Fusarium pseudograminearum]
MFETDLDGRTYLLTSTPETIEAQGAMVKFSLITSVLLNAFCSSSNTLSYLKLLLLNIIIPKDKPGAYILNIRHLYLALTCRSSLLRLDPIHAQSQTYDPNS